MQEHLPAIRLCACILFSASYFLNKLPAQTVDCDTVQVVAQAIVVKPITCDEPIGTLAGVVHPSAFKYHWSGNFGQFTSDNRVISRPESGFYSLTVTGAYGCTATTSITLTDDCFDYPLLPPPCPNPFLPPAENCEEACVRQFLPTNYLFNNFGAQPSPAQFWPCGISHNDQWFALVARSTGGEITAQAQNCVTQNGIQLNLYADCSYSQNSLVACNGGMPNGASQEITLTATDLIPGKVYFLMVDGFEGDQCEYYFPADSISGTPTPIPHHPSLLGPNNFCAGAVVNYTLDDPPFATAFLWTGPPGTLFNGLPSPALFYVPDGIDVTITLGPDTGFICVRAINYFQLPSHTFCIDIHHTLIPATVLPEVMVCYDDLPYELPWGDYAFGSGLYEYTYANYQNCDSLVRQQVTVIPPIIKQLGNIIRCAGDCFEIGGTQYCEPGSYVHVLTSAAGCDSVVTFNLAPLNPIAQINGGGTLTCANPQITLSAAPTPGLLRWENLAGQFLGVLPQIQVTSPGTYILKTLLIVGGTTCTASDTIVVSQNTTVPQLQAHVSQTLSCIIPEIPLQLYSPDTLTTIFWTGPNGFQSNQAEPLITEAGNYTVVASGLNGCTTSVTLVVEADLEVPEFTLSADTLDCTQPQTALQVQTLFQNGLYEWMGPNGFVSGEPEPVVSDTGIYFLRLTNPANGCFTQDTIEVSANFTISGVDVVQQAPDCGDTLLIVNASAGIAGVEFNWTGPNQFTAQGQHLEVQVPGWYILRATTATGCKSQISILVVAAPQNPQVSISGPDTVDCINLTAPVLAESDIPGCTFLWSGPDGFTTNLAGPELPLPGIYLLTVSSPGNCTTTVDFQVEADTISPIITATGGVISCTNPVVVLSASSFPANADFTWTGPSGSSTDNPWLVSEPGLYQVMATLPNGCSAMETVSVLDSCLTKAINQDAVETGILVYPNASTGLVNVRSLSGVPIEAWGITGADGRVLRQVQLDYGTSFLSLNLQNLTAGAYRLQVLVQNKWIYRTIILLE